MDTVPHQRVRLILTVGHLWLHGIYHLLHGRQLSSNGWQKMSPNLPVQSCKPDKIELMSMFTKALSWFMLFLAKQHLAIGKITYFHTDIFFLFYLHHNADYIFFPLLVTLMWLLKNQFFSIDLYIQSLIFTDINICSYIILDGGIDNASTNPSYACIEMHILNDPYSNF